MKNRSLSHLPINLTKTRTLMILVVKNGCPHGVTEYCTYKKIKKRILSNVSSLSIIVYLNLIRATTSQFILYFK